jgi:hypothetical protein
VIARDWRCPTCSLIVSDDHDINGPECLMLRDERIAKNIDPTDAEIRNL